MTVRGHLVTILAVMLAWIPQRHWESDAFCLTMTGWGHGSILSRPVAESGLRLQRARQDVCVGEGPLGSHKELGRTKAVMPLRMQEIMEDPILEGVKNVRDLASVTDSPVKPGRVFRAACIGSASEKDSTVIIDFMNIRTLVDLRSEQEWNGDILKYNSTIFDSYDSMFYEVRRSKKNGRPKAVLPLQDPVSGGSARTRHLLSVIDESIYKRGVFKKLGWSKKAKAALYIGLSYTKARKIFLDYINAAGLPLLNELILDYGGASIRAVLQVLSDKNQHPVCFYCTAGKDRTGLIAMLILLVLGVDREAILNDYVLSDSVYADLNDKDAMVGALQQQQLDPERFLRAPRAVMEATMDLLYRDYGGAEKYLDKIGFTAADRERLRAALCD